MSAICQQIFGHYENEGTEYEACCDACLDARCCRHGLLASQGKTICLFSSNVVVVLSLCASAINSVNAIEEDLRSKYGKMPQALEDKIGLLLLEKIDFKLNSKNAVTGMEEHKSNFLTEC